MSTFGPDYSPVVDGPRINRQHEAIKALMLDGIWRSLAEIEALTGYPQASISAQLRHLRKPQFGSYVVLRRMRESGLREYQVSPVKKHDPIHAAPTPAAQGTLFNFSFDQHGEI